MTVLADKSIVDAAVARMVAFQDDVKTSQAGDRVAVTDDATTGIAVITGISARQIQSIAEQHIAAIQQTVWTDQRTLPPILRGERERMMFLGWLIRDEQAKAEPSADPEFDPPAVCESTQADLAEFRFCPHCGIIRVLHSEE